MFVRPEAQVEPIPGYKLLDRLGAGGFGEVWRCEAPGGIFKAVKIIHGDLRSKDSDLVRYAEQELKSLKRVKQVRHPYLLALDRFDIIDGRLMIVMELADCNLWDRFRACREAGLIGIPRDELLQYMAEIAEVLDLFNDQFQLQHLDIKPQNLFLLYNHVKVADFGQVKDLQGLMAQVTGGITPVYAAPETFDGVITRYCDQYSLACVYQELLTGARPFDGSSMSQLLMQHLSLPPYLDPSPPADRPALARALAKKPEERWPSVSAFVRALAGAPPLSGISAPGRFNTSESETPNLISVPPAPGSVFSSLSLTDDTPQRGETYGPVFTPAPPELSGDGPLQPALVLGLGNAGLRVIQRLRFDLNERYGRSGLTPALRTLYIDTDSEAIDEANRERPADRLAKLDADEVFAAKLNRAGHYLKPRFNGRSLTEGWFDAQLLYKIPRAPQTLGIRSLGRLAFLDHYRALMTKVQADLDAAVTPDALLLTEARTGLKRRTNRPRVYITGSLAGGTSGGMFLDLAFAVRNRLKRMGYERPEIIGLFVLPPADATLTPPQALGNTFAALTELNHYSRSDTQFTAHFDERSGYVKEQDAPFTRCYLLPGSASGVVPQSGVGITPPPGTPNPGSRARFGSGGVQKPGSRIVALGALGSQRTPDPGAAAAALKPYGDAAERIRLDLFSPIGRCTDETRAAEEVTEHPGPVTVSAFGVATFDWPRAEVVSRTAASVGREILRRWAAPDLKRVREVMPGIAESRWTQLGLDPETIIERLQRAADQSAGRRVDTLVESVTEPLVPRGWLNRLPEPTQIHVALNDLNRLLGPPAASVKRPQTALEEEVARAAADAGSAFALDLRTLAPVLVDDAEFRLAGTEELFRQFLATTDRLIDRYTHLAVELDSKAVAGFECLSRYAHYQKGMWKPSAAELTDALRQYPRARFQALTFRQMVTAYQIVRDVLSMQIADVAVARQRMATASASVPDAPPEPPASLRRLMPPGCPTIGDAVNRFLKVLSDADLTDIDRRVQSVLEPETGGLFQVCLNSSSGVEDVIAVVFEETRAHLDQRLGEVGLASMFAERFRTPQQAERAIEQAYQEAEPAWAGNGPWAASEVSVLSCPGGTSGEALRELARRAIPIAALPITDSCDDLTIYREWTSVPLAALPHLGPAAAAAYDAIPDANQCSPHTRLDITAWFDVDSK